MYQGERKKLHDGFKKLSSQISFTSDIWISNQKIGYVFLTAHYIDSDFILYNKIINFKKLSYFHISFAIEDAIGKYLFEWKLNFKMCAIILDNYTTNDVIIQRI